MNRKWLLPMLLMLGLLLAGVFPAGAAAAERSSWLAKAANRAQKLAAERAVVKAANLGSSQVAEPVTQPTPPAPIPQPAPDPNPENGSKTFYTVQQGDSLYKIAQKYWASVTALKTANGLNSDEIYVGQVLIIPAAAGRTGPPEVSRGLSLSREDIDLIARVVYAEAQGEIYEGQVAVAAVILNRLKNPDFPKTIRGIVYEKYAFESVANGQINQVPNARAYQAVQDALNGWDPTGGALYFWNPAGSTSKWIQTRTIIKRIGNHVFGV